MVQVALSDDEVIAAADMVQVAAYLINRYRSCLLLLHCTSRALSDDGHSDESCVSTPHAACLAIMLMLLLLLTVITASITFVHHSMTNPQVVK